MAGILSVCVAWCVIVSLLERACLPLALSLSVSLITAVLAADCG